MHARICFIGNPTSISYLIGKELLNRGYEVEIISNGSMFQTNLLDNKQLAPSAKPSLMHRAIRKYAKPLYRATINSRSYDIELRSFSNPIVKATYRAVIYHGNDLRDKLWPVLYPCFYSTKELGLLYLEADKIRDGEAVWLPRCFVSDFFAPEERLPFD